MRILRPGQKIITIGNPGLSVISPRGGAAIPWYLAGGVDAANCVAAYQPMGAASYATGKVNLTGDTDYDCVDGAAYPTWDDVNGWKFLNTSSQYLGTGIYAASGYSFAIRFSNQADSNGWMMGSFDGTNRIFGINPRMTATRVGFALGGYKELSVPNYESGVAIGTNQLLYVDGTQIGTASADWSGVASPDEIKVGTYELGSTAYHKTGYVQALAIYNTDITAYVAAITAAMQAI